MKLLTLETLCVAKLLEENKKKTKRIEIFSSRTIVQKKQQQKAIKNT